MRRVRALAAHLTGSAENEKPPAAPLRGEGLPFEPLVHAADDSLPGAFGIELTPEEIVQFKEEGWIVKRGLIPKEELTPWVHRSWDKVEGVVPFLDRNNPETWLDPAERPTGWVNTQNAPGERSQSADGELSAVSEWRWHHAGHDPDFLAATSAHPNVLTAVESLMGGPVRVPNRNRGIYFIFPRSLHERQGLPIQAQLGPHIDPFTALVSAAIYLDDVGPRAGGFTLWPGSAQLLYKTMRQDRNFTPTEEYGPTLQHIKDTITPIEFPGAAGDVILYHHLALHSTGINTSGRVRIGSIHDFQRVQPAAHMSWQAAGGHIMPRAHDGSPEMPEYNAVGKEVAPELRVAKPCDVDVGSTWFVDTMEFGPTHPIKDDMWEGWNLGTRPVLGHSSAVREASWWAARGMEDPWSGMPQRTLADALSIGMRRSW
jgi:hypothetical protein